MDFFQEVGVEMSFKLLDLKVPLAAIKMDLNEDLTLIPNRKTLLNDLIEALDLENAFKITDAYTLNPGLYDDGFIALQNVKSNLDNGGAAVDDDLKIRINTFITEINKLNGGKRQSRRSRQSRKSRKSRKSRSRKSSTRKSQRRA